MGIDDIAELSATVDGLLHRREHPVSHQSKFEAAQVVESYSEGFAGSMMTASLDLSSVTR